MSDPASVTTHFLEVLTKDRAASVALLSPQVTFVCAVAQASGPEAVVTALLKQDSGLISKIKWRQPKPFGNGMLVEGDAPENEGKLGYISILHFTDGKIASIEQQDMRDTRSAGAVRRRVDPEAVKLPEELKEFIRLAIGKNPMTVACTDAGGQPVISLRGSIFAYSDDQFALWIRNPEGEFVTCITGNPKVALLYRDQVQRATFQFRGRAGVTTDEAERERIFAAIPLFEQNHDFAKVGAAIIIDLDMVEGYFNLDPGWKMLTQIRQG